MKPPMEETAAAPVEGSGLVSLLQHVSNSWIHMPMVAGQHLVG